MIVAYASLVNSGGVMVRSPSGDIDIVTLLLYHAMSFDADMFIENGTGSQRKVLEINSCGLSDEQRSAIIGLHAFSGNDYLSSFFRKGKATCWKKAGYVAAFSLLGSTYLVDTEVTQNIEKYRSLINFLGQVQQGQKNC